MSRVIDPKRIKSAQRVLEILEYFNEDRPTATVMDIARKHDYPQSSTSELLGCLVELGYLRRDHSARNYRPTAKVAMLGAWVHPRLMRHGNLFTMIDDLAVETGCSVVLGGAVGLSVQHFHVTGSGPDPEGEDAPGGLTRGVMGRLLLSLYDRSHTRKIVHRLNAEAAQPEMRVSCEALLKEIDRIQRFGFSASADLSLGGMCAVLLPRGAADEPLALGIVVPRGDERGCDHYLRALRNAVSQHIGPLLAHRQSDTMLASRQAY